MAGEYGGKGGQGKSGSPGDGGNYGNGFSGTGDSGGGGGAGQSTYAGGAGGNNGGGDVGGSGGSSGSAGGSSATLAAYTGTVTAGAGGGGTAGADGKGAGGGGGGAGGYGFISTNDNSFAVKPGASITGGLGGAGGGGGDGGSGSGGGGGGGGGGGIGLLLGGSNEQLRNYGTLKGGTAGAGAPSGGGGFGRTGGVGGVGGNGVSDPSTQGGTVVNYAQGMITGGEGGGGGGGGGTLKLGSGGHGGDGGNGVYFNFSGVVENHSSATITGGAGGAGGSGDLVSYGGSGGAGVLISGSGGQVANSGSITGGVAGYSPGAVSPGASGGSGVQITSGSMYNTSMITGGAGAGGIRSQGSRAAAGKGGYGVEGSGSFLVNTGTITGGAGGQYAPGKGQPGGTDGYAGAGVDGAGMTIVDTGTIAGGSPSVDAITFTGGANFLALGSTATLNGALDIKSGTLIFDQSKGAGQVANVTLPTDVTVSAPIIGHGSVVKVGAGKLTLTNSGNTFSGGTTTIEGGTLELATPTSGGANAAITFQPASGATATLALETGAQPDDMGTFGTALDSFGDGDSLDLEGLTYSGAGTTPLLFDGTTLTVVEDGKTEDFTLSNVPTGTLFFAHADAAGTGTLVDDILCFVQGTKIRVARGGGIIDVAVEDLVVGDLAVTTSGAPRPIRWLGHRAIDCRLHPRSDRAMPIRVAAHAFDEGLPARDLFLSPGHPILVGSAADGEGGHLVPIMCLVNGTTIERVSVDAVTYWHVEFDAHDILLAEGLPVESYLDWGDRGFFTEGADHALADPDFVVPGLAARCRPVVLDGPVVEAERRRLDVVFAMRLVAACHWHDLDAALGF